MGGWILVCMVCTIAIFLHNVRAENALNDAELRILEANGFNITDVTSNNTITISHHGFPDHLDGTEDWGNNPSTADYVYHNFNLPREATVSNPKGCAGDLGPIGVAISGAALYNPYTGFGKNAVEGECAEDLDDCQGHPSPDSTYHYHAIPECLYTGNDLRDMFLGVALDGYPIYGPMTGEGNTLTSADLDICHGHYYNGRYMYRMTYDFPYIIGCFHGNDIKDTLRMGGNGGPLVRRKRQMRPPPPGGGTGGGPLGGDPNNPCNSVSQQNWAQLTCYIRCFDAGNYLDNCTTPNPEDTTQNPTVTTPTSVAATPVTSRQTTYTASPTERTEISTGRTDRSTERTESSTERTERPTERTERPTERTERPTERTVRPTEYTERTGRPTDGMTNENPTTFVPYDSRNALTGAEIRMLESNGITVISNSGNQTLTLRHLGVPSHEHNTDVVDEQYHSFNIPRLATVAEEKGCVRLGPIGLSISGATFFNPYTRNGYNAVEGDCKESFDDCSGHPTGDGHYHYHKLPRCLYTGSDLRDKFLGVAFDGYPIYGPMDSNGKNWNSRELDKCHGHVDTADGRYKYRITTDFPYILGCYHGDVYNRHISRMRRNANFDNTIIRYRRQIVEPCERNEDDWVQETCYAFCQRPALEYDACPAPSDAIFDNQDTFTTDSYAISSASFSRFSMPLLLHVFTIALLF
ncbi:hypothetical protein ACF0H5_018631 [Mactra antiquata]